MYPVYVCNAAGRLVREGERSFFYGWMDKVLSVSDAEGIRTYSYGMDGQLASATAADGAVSEFLWDGLALIRRDGVDYLNEPHPNGGSPILASDGRFFFNDILGTSQGTLNDSGYESAPLTAFGDGADGVFFTGKPKVDNALGYAFLFRNYRPDNGKWLTADPMGYPDGWNNLAYCNNWANDCIDVKGADIYHVAYTTGPCGHSSVIIGNPQDGYYAYNNGGDGGGYSHHSAIGSDAQRYDSASAAMAALDEGRGEDIAYDCMQKWTTSREQDGNARQAAKDSIDRGYNSITNTCMNTVNSALNAADVVHVSPPVSQLATGAVLSIYNSPLVFFIWNLVFFYASRYGKFQSWPS